MRFFRTKSQNQQIQLSQTFNTIETKFSQYLGGNHQFKLGFKEALANQDQANDFTNLKWAAKNISEVCDALAEAHVNIGQVMKEVTYNLPPSEFFMDLSMDNPERKYREDNNFNSAIVGQIYQIIVGKKREFDERSHSPSPSTRLSNKVVPLDSNDHFPSM